MFWNKKKKKEGAAEVSPTPMFPAFKMDEEGNFRLSFDDMKPLAEPKLVTDRIYVISRGNIDLKEAQNITVHAAMAHPEFAENLLTDEHVDLVWCSAYPDAIFSDYKLPSLLIGYIQKSEGDKYLKGDSKLIPIEGNKDGDEYYILILIHMEF
ncbi:MAG: hypothetical protein ACOYEL_05915 [Saccharofermentanales bacterium]|jgi:hypothetical protein